MMWAEHGNYTLIWSDLNTHLTGYTGEYRVLHRRSFGSGESQARVTGFTGRFSARTVIL